MIKISEEEWKEIRKIAYKFCIEKKDCPCAEKEFHQYYGCWECNEEALKQSGIIRTEDKDDRVSEEWARKFLEDAFNLPQSITRPYIENLKQNNRIRKTKLEEAREKTDKIIADCTIYDKEHIYINKKFLKQHIQAEREAGEK